MNKRPKNCLYDVQVKGRGARNVVDWWLGPYQELQTALQLMRHMSLASLRDQAGCSR